MWQHLVAMPARTVLIATILAASLRILILTHQAPAPDFGHLGELADADSQLVSLAQKAFMNSKMALFIQVRQ